MTKETEVVAMLLESFNEGWKIDDKGRLSLKSEDGDSEFVYVDYSNYNLQVDIREISLRINKDWYRLMEYPTKGNIVYVLVMPPFRGEPLGQEENYPERCYAADGVLCDAENLEGLPRKIDMEKTARLFFEQVAQKDFSKPVLVRQER